MFGFEVITACSKLFKSSKKVIFLHSFAKINLNLVIKTMKM